MDCAAGGGRSCYAGIYFLEEVAFELTLMDEEGVWDGKKERRHSMDAVSNVLITVTVIHIGSKESLIRRWPQNR